MQLAVTAKTRIAPLSSTYGYVYEPGSVVLSPDQRRFLFVATMAAMRFPGRTGEVVYSTGARHRTMFVIIDGKGQGVYYDSIGQGTLRFSPDSKHVAYLAGVGDKQLVVIDSTEQRAYDSILEGGVIFSPDSRRFAYGAQLGGLWRVVVDGKEGKAYDGIVRDTVLSHMKTPAIRGTYERPSREYESSPASAIMTPP